jgi:hypothetical protein
MILNVNSDYFLKQRQPVDLCNGEVLKLVSKKQCQDGVFDPWIQRKNYFFARGEKNVGPL